MILSVIMKANILKETLRN